MKSVRENDRAPVCRILHTTDFSHASNVAFLHALVIALAARAELNILHVSRPGDELDWSKFPRVRRTLQRWAEWRDTTSRATVAGAGLRVGKILGVHAEPVRSVLEHLKLYPTELIVLATHQRTGLGRLFHTATAGPIARGSGEMTLFLPEGVEGFVSRRNGALVLGQILIAVDRAPAPQAAVDGVTELLDGLGCSEARVTLLHVGEERSMPRVRSAGGRDRRWEYIVRRGDPAEEIVRAADERAAGLIVMTTEGRHGFLDAFRGSTTERVLRRAACPVLAVPAGSRAMARLFRAGLIAREMYRPARAGEMAWSPGRQP